MMYSVRTSNNRRHRGRSFGLDSTASFRCYANAKRYIPEEGYSRLKIERRIFTSEEELNTDT